MGILSNAWGKQAKTLDPELFHLNVVVKLSETLVFFPNYL